MDANTVDCSKFNVVLWSTLGYQYAILFVLVTFKLYALYSLTSYIRIGTKLQLRVLSKRIALASSLVAVF